MKTKILIATLFLISAIGLVASFEEKKSYQEGVEVTVASWNVENLFDMKESGKEYEIYRPYHHGWVPEIMAAKVRNIARVIAELNATIIGLQEIESQEALDALTQELKRINAPYPYSLLAKGESTVHVALLSRLPIEESESIPINQQSQSRHILKVRVLVGGAPLTIFVNHWSSKRHPESSRHRYANALKKEISKLDPGEDYMILGDLNTNHDECRTLVDEARLNDTFGVVGLNHILATAPRCQPVTEKTLNNTTHYDLWYELPPDKRASHISGRHADSLDHILLPSSLYDDQGVSYIDNSFVRFDPPWLFRHGQIFRWQITKGGKGEHLGEGYSDHLPIIARFRSGRFQAVGEQPITLTDKNITIMKLYELPDGPIEATINEAVAIWQEGDRAIVKEENGRAIMVLGVDKQLTLGGVYKLHVKGLGTFHGLREVTAATIEETGLSKPITPLLLSTPLPDLTNGLFQNEVVASIEGELKRTTLTYGNGYTIKVYFKDKSLKPKSGRVRLTMVLVGYFDRPQLVVSRSEQIEWLGPLP
ncbi:MAG: endonuclease/exonuclease/phosphatase family protein [Campylobacterales bacterium]